MTQDLVVNSRIPKAGPVDKNSLAYIWFAAQRDFKALVQEAADDLHDLRFYKGAAQEARLHNNYSLYLKEGEAMKAARTDPHETWLSLKPEQRAQFQADYLEGLVPRSHPLAIPASNEVAKPETYGWHQTEIDAERIASYARTAVMPDRLAIVSEGPNPWLSEADFDSLRQERQALHARKVLEPHAYTKADSQRAFLITDRLDEHSLAAATLADTARRYDRLIKEGPNAGLRAVGVDVSNLEAMPARHREEIEKVGSYLDRKLAARREVQRDAGIGRLLSQRELGSLDAYGKMVSDDTDMRQMSTHYHEGLAKVSERGAAKAAQDLQQPIKRVEFEPIAQRKPSEGRMLGQ